METVRLKPGWVSAPDFCCWLALAPVTIRREFLDYKNNVSEEAFFRLLVWTVCGMDQEGADNCVRANFETLHR